MLERRPNYGAGSLSLITINARIANRETAEHTLKIPKYPRYLRSQDPDIRPIEIPKLAPHDLAERTFPQ